jgi:aryl-alcohol dehydrogenase-like predicted oxidoreductase
MAQSLPQRALGKSGINVSAIGLGCMSFSGVYGPSEDAAAVTLINQALDAGITMLDSSDAYGKGQNETLVGSAIKGRRADVVLATKFGNLGGAGGKYADGRPEFVVSSCEASLKRLGVDVIDLYYAHRIDTTVPIEDTVGAMSDLVAGGKVRHLGICEAGPATIRRAHATHRMSAVQVEYSLWSRDVEAEIVPLCEELGIGFVAYSPLGRGFLTGTIDNRDSLAPKDVRLSMPRFQADNMQHNLDLLAGLKRVAADAGKSPAQVAIAWLLSRSPPLVVLAGSSRRRWLEENAGAIEVKLSEKFKQELDRIFALGVAQGDRYPPGQMRRLGL